MSRKTLPSINPNGARYSVRVEAKASHPYTNRPDHHGTISTSWRKVMRLVAAYEAAGFSVTYSERWVRHDQACWDYRMADIECHPPQRTRP